MHLITKNNWLLTKYTAKRLLEQFDGTEEELIEYVANNYLEQDTFSKININGKEQYAHAPRVFVGEYTLFSNANGIYATEDGLI